MRTGPYTVLLPIVKRTVALPRPRRGHGGSRIDHSKPPRRTVVRLAEPMQPHNSARAEHGEELETLPTVRTIKGSLGRKAWTVRDSHNESSERDAIAIRPPHMTDSELDTIPRPTRHDPLQTRSRVSLQQDMSLGKARECQGNSIAR